ncbi:MAG TPA: hypothetical protein VLT87_07475, partial [Thermoanaerobaculia bacterium]|nr:hypothetical protein [Thermoanaerobaculia bacterium]
MKFKALLTALTLCLLMAGQELHAFAEPTTQDPTENDLYDQLIKEGWTLTAAGVLQRQIGAGKVETLGFGAEGLRFKLEEMRGQLAFLREEYKHRPLPETRRSIRAYRIQIARVI